MDTHSDDLNELERRLSGWEPAQQALDADAMLFAAGRAAGQRGAIRRVWPTLTGLLGVVVLALLFWGMGERKERVRLADQLRLQPVPTPPLPHDVSPMPTPADDTGSTAILAVHRALERGQDDWAIQPTKETDAPGLPGAPAPVLQLGQRNAMLTW